jgi:glycosyltransferase involved in cell wall biosynthesis
MFSKSPRTAAGNYVRGAVRSEGLFFDDFAPDSAWIRERGRIFLPPLRDLKQLIIFGETKTHPDVEGIEVGIPRLDIFAGGQHVATISIPADQPWELPIDIKPEWAADGTEISLQLRNVFRSNFFAWFARVAEKHSFADRFQRFRRQNKNRQQRIRRIEADGLTMFDFALRDGPYSPAFARQHNRLGLNVIGFITADLGIGESARAMVRAADAVKIPTAAVQLKLPCKSRLGDRTLIPFLQDTNPHAVNVFHLDAPASRDIETHHGKDFRSGKYNIGYWAWELPEFPDSWLSAFSYFHEIWVPSEFVRDAVAAKSPLPVVTMPHSIEFSRPISPLAELRASFSLPDDKYLFLFLYDLNSYSARKNPQAVIEAYRCSQLAARGAGLVIKIHSVQGNEAEFAALQKSLSDLPNTYLITDSLSRSRVYDLEAACDCFVSLHRSEGFGFAIAECMYLGKPVIATDWSATKEFLNTTNGAPVRMKLIRLERSHGPYAQGQQWAEPDVAHAAEWMQQLFEDRALGERLGASAQATIEREFSLAAIGARYRRRLEAIASW